MDPALWGPYGWKMIHAFSKIPVSFEEYTQWLKATARILPCRKCRNNFKRHIRSHKCDNAKSNEYLSICLHNAVSEEIKGSQSNTSIDDLPKPTLQNLFPSEFLSTFYLNTTLGKDSVILKWLSLTEILILKNGYEKEADYMRDLWWGISENVFTKDTDLTRKRAMKTEIQKFQLRMGLKKLTLKDETYLLGKSSKPSATRKRARKLARKEPSGRTRRASRNLR